MPRKPKQPPIVPAVPKVIEKAWHWLVREGKPDTVEILPNGIELLQRMARDGHNRASMAAALGFGKTTLNSCVKRQPEVEEAIDAGRAVLDHEVHDLLLNLGRKGHVVALIFLAKCRLGWRETEPEDVKPNIQIINLNAAARTLKEWKPPAFASPQLKEGEDQ